MQILDKKTEREIQSRASLQQLKQLLELIKHKLSYLQNKHLRIVGSSMSPTVALRIKTTEQDYTYHLFTDTETKSFLQFLGCARFSTTGDVVKVKRLVLALVCQQSSLPLEPFELFTRSSCIETTTSEATLIRLKSGLKNLKNYCVREELEIEYYSILKTTTHSGYGLVVGLVNKKGNKRSPALLMRWYHDEKLPRTAHKSFYFHNKQQRKAVHEFMNSVGIPYKPPRKYEFCKV